MRGYIPANGVAAILLFSVPCARSGRSNSGHPHPGSRGGVSREYYVQQDATAAACQTGSIAHLLSRVCAKQGFDIICEIERRTRAESGEA